MKILSAEQIHALDKYTIEHEPISSIDLMERAASRLTESLTDVIAADTSVFIFCGMGNNGGDGLAIARMLISGGYSSVLVFVVKHSQQGSPDFLVNQERLAKLGSIRYIETEDQIPAINKSVVVVDAIFGSGLSRPAEGISASVIKAINASGALCYAVDVPSGLYCDKLNGPEDVIIESTCSYTFHAPKLAFLWAHNAKYVPRFEILDIGLSMDYESQIEVANEYVDDAVVAGLFHKRGKFSHKGTYGHALISAGSYGKMGAAILSVGAALKSGAGLVSAHIARCGYTIMQTANPEAMVEADLSENELTELTGFNKFSAIGIGPGIGQSEKTANFLETLLRGYGKPIVLDADALNIISGLNYLKEHIPVGSILTPHPGEFKRMVGDWSDDMIKIQRQLDFSTQHQVVVVLKGANTSISTPEGKVYYNSTGNPGMAKGGSGDVLTGIITALLAQGYSSVDAAIIGVFIHGRAGDIADEVLGQTGMTARDIIQFLPEAFAALE